MKTTTTSIKRLVAALAVLTLVISCSKSDGLPTSQSDSQSKARHSGGGGGGVDTSIPQVTGLSATVLGPNTVYLTWNSLSGATSYWVYRNNTVIAIMTSTNYTDSYATPGVSYTYTVAPVVNSVLGPQSASVTVTTQ
jgi:rhamnogalacturonan lyase-like protein